MAKSRMPYHFRYHDDALRGYRELSLEERGAYTTLLDLMYSNQDYLQDNERILAAEMGVSMRKYRTLRDGLLRKGKIYYVSPGLMSNRRFEEEIERREQRRSSAQIRGKFGGRNSREIEKFRKENNGRREAISSSPEPDNINNTDRASLTGGDWGTKGVTLHPAVEGLLTRQKARKS